MFQSEWLMLDIISLGVYIGSVPQLSKNWKELRLFFFFGLAWLTSFREKVQLHQQKVSTRAFCQLSQRNAALGHSATPALSQMCKPCQQSRHEQSFRQANQNSCADVLPSYLNFWEFRFMCHLIEFLPS